tara:strand:- start:70 stop:708 length:639 start_codon:yes stop_codon:yes gene_type:complete
MNLMAYNKRVKSPSGLGRQKASLFSAPYPERYVYKECVMNKRIILIILISLFISGCVNVNFQYYYATTDPVSIDEITIYFPIDDTNDLNLGWAYGSHTRGEPYTLLIRVNSTTSISSPILINSINLKLNDGSNLLSDQLGELPLSIPLLSNNDGNFNGELAFSLANVLTFEEDSDLTLEVNIEIPDKLDAQTFIIKYSTRETKFLGSLLMYQ